MKGCVSFSPKSCDCQLTNRCKQDKMARRFLITSANLSKFYLFFSAVKCPNCSEGYLLPKNSLDYDSLWNCNDICENKLLQGCSYETTAKEVEKIVDEIEEHLENINCSGQFEDYSKFIQVYRETLLHKNHYLILTAARNLIQWYTYRANEVSEDELREKLELCRQLDLILSKIDPGYSEIRSFVQKELHFTNLVINRQDLQHGILDPETYLEESRISMKALDELDRYKSNIKFNCDWTE